MADIFNTLAEWLKDSKELQPPNYYELLGIPVFEDNPILISEAAVKRIQCVRARRCEQNRELCDEIVRWLVDARADLLDDEGKKSLDRQLAQRLQVQPPGDDSRTGGKPPKSAQAAVPIAGSSKKVRSPRMAVLLQAVQIVAGGLIAILIGIPLLWWVFGKDPFGIVPQLPERVEFLAPASLRGKSHRETVVADRAGNGPNPRRTRENVPPRHDQQPVDRQLTDVPRGAKADLKAAVETPPPQQDPFRRLSPFKAAELPTAPDVENGDAFEIPGFAGEGFPTLDGKARIGVRDAKPRSAADLNVSLAAAEENVQRLASADGADAIERDDRITLLFELCCEVAENLTLAPFSDEERLAQNARVEASLADVFENQTEFDLWDQLAAGRLGQANRARHGVLLVAVVAEIRSSGPLFETQIAPREKPTEVVSVYTWRDPAAHCASGDQVVVLGVIVDDPATNLGGYQGGQGDEAVVWSHCIFAVGGDE